MGTFPFDILQVAALLHLTIRRQTPYGIYTDCPICGDQRGKMFLRIGENVYRCNICGVGGGMLDLYARVQGLGSNSEAYQDICEQLLYGDDFTIQEPLRKAAAKAPPPQSERADIAELHHTYTALLHLLPLSALHREKLRKRGLSDAQIDALEYRSTPAPGQYPQLAEALFRQGCILQGVPGFYVDKQDRWTMNFKKRTAGILVPARDLMGQIQGMQIRLDTPLKDKGADPDKTGAKYLWFSSSAYRMGVTSGSPAHLAGDPYARKVYVTEGILKADVAHCLSQRTFAAIAGINNLSALETLLSTLQRNGTEVVVEAADMDKFSNPAVYKGMHNLLHLARSKGMQTVSLTWDGNYKGIDDWILSLKQSQKEVFALQTFPISLDCSKEIRFRVYQLRLGQKLPPVPFAFQEFSKLQKAGYTQPPAELYRLTCEDNILCNRSSTESDVLQRLFAAYNRLVEKEHIGRYMAASDVVQVQDGPNESYYYYDGQKRFRRVKFSPALKAA